MLQSAEPAAQNRHLTVVGGGRWGIVSEPERNRTLGCVCAVLTDRQYQVQTV